MRRLLLGAFGAALLIAAGHAQAPAPTLHEAMKNVVAPQAQILWDVGNLAMDDAGKTDAKRLGPAQWAQIGDAGRKVQDMALTLAMMQPVKVVAPGAAIQGEGDPHSSQAVQVQGFIDADPAGFADHARKLAAVAGIFVAAAKGRDAAKLGEASDGLDEVCESCHMRFWYPQQTAK